MDLTQLAALGSFVSGVAVVMSLAFVGLQMRQANRNQRSLMQQGRSTRHVELLLRLGDPLITNVMARLHTKGVDAISDAELQTVYFHAAATFWSYEDSFLQHRNGMLDDASWTSDVLTLKRIVATPVNSCVWRVIRDGLGRDYQAFVDDLVAQAAGADARSSAPQLRMLLDQAFAAQSAKGAQAPE
jgi:hypothetical protein